MGDDADDRERLITMEVEVRHLTAKVDAMARQVQEMHDLLLRLRGAQWLALGLMAAIGFLGAKASGLIALLR